VTLGRCAAIAAASLLFAAPAAQAAFVRAAAVDGPSADVVAPGDVELTPSGAGALTYLKREGGSTHVFVALLTRGTPGPPQRVDLGQTLDSSQPRIAVAERGRVLVAWVNDGKLYASLRRSATSGFAPPALAYAPASGTVQDPALSMTINGKGYAAATTSSGDVRAAYMKAGGSWSAPDTPLDVDPAHPASGAAVAASGDGTALFGWTETGADGVSRVFVRRAVGARLSIVAPEVSVPSLDGRPGGNADTVSLGIEYDSAVAWVAFRQDFSEGGATVSRSLGRRFLGSSFDDPPFPIDGLEWPAGGGSDHPRVAFTGGRRGTFTASLRSPAGITGMLLKNDVLSRLRRLDTGVFGAAQFPAPTASDDATGTVSWQRDPGTGAPRSIVGRHLAAGPLPGQAVLSRPSFGAVDASTGLEASGDKGGDAAITFAQGDPSSRRVVVALYDAPPRQPHAHDEKKYRSNPRPRFHWSTVTDTWSKIVRYRIEIDRKPVVTLTGTTWYPPRPIPNGDHRWRIVTIDARGQETVGRERHLRIKKK
jgi:hypothetical protein